MENQQIVKPALKPGLKVHRRLLGEHKGTPGLTVIFLAGMHGNEESGVVAVKRVFERLIRLGIEPRGHLLGLSGNLAALSSGTRYIDFDLNRMWRDDAPRDRSISEFTDFSDLNRRLVAQAKIAKQPLTIIDLHSFSGLGQPFIIAPNQGYRASLIERMPFPVIKGLNDFVHGTFCGYLETLGHTTMALEGGHETDPAVAVNMEAFLWQILARLGVIDPALVPPSVIKSWRAMFDEEAHLPRILRVVYRHKIEPGDTFVMHPGFGTFHQIHKGQLLANDRHGPIYAPHKGRLLLPLYQGKGEDGFFIAVAEENPNG